MAEKPKILIIEDSETQALQVAAHLSRFDISVLIAKDGPQGLRLADVHQPALIVLDVNLPSMNGYQVCRRIKRDISTQNIPVVMLTTANTPADKLKGLNAGADGYIIKGATAIDQLLDILYELQLIQ